MGDNGLVSSGQPEHVEKEEQMELRQLRYLVAIVDEGGIRKAARHLYLAQPSLSKTLRQLEGELGIELLRRGPAGTELTSAGMEFVTYAREILDRAETAQAAMRRRVEQRSTRLRVGLLSGTIAAGELTAPILQQFQTDHPDVEVELHDIGMDDQAMPLYSGEIDVAIVRGPLVDRELDVVPLAFDRTAVMVAATHELADEDEVTLDDILPFRMTPAVTPGYFLRFWHLDELRGGSHVDRSLPPARTVAEVQLAVATGRVIAATVSMITRALPNTLVRTVPLRDGPMSTIAVARQRADHRGVVRDFVESAVAGVAAGIGELPGGTLPS
jgi:DNA-binding transcriptional LysR family regulator